MSFISFPEDLVDPKLKRAQSLVGYSDSRAEHDFYPTPRNAVEALLSVEKFEGPIWEPCCGDGAISQVLEDYGHVVHSTDLIYRGYGVGEHDFLTSPLTSDNIITNPPFKLAEKFIRLSLERTTRKVCMLCKLAILEGSARRVLFESSPLKNVWVFSKRLTMTRNGQAMKNSGMIAFAWITFEHNYVGRPMIGWL